MYLIFEMQENIISYKGGEFVEKEQKNVLMVMPFLQGAVGGSISFRKVINE